MQEYDDDTAAGETGSDVFDVPVMMHYYRDDSLFVPLSVTDDDQLLENCMMNLSPSSTAPSSRSFFHEMSPTSAALIHC